MSIVLAPPEMNFGDYLNGIATIVVFITGIATVSKYIVLWIVKGIIKFKILKHTANSIQIKEYVFKRS